jgi:AraC-like DNA-binding protein
MNYKQFFPCEQLKPFVKYFWVLDSLEEVTANRCFQVIPDGLPGLIIQEKRSFKDSEGNLLPQAFLYGQTTRNSHQVVYGNFKNIGVYFQPHALKAIFGIDAHEMTDLEVDLDNIISMRGISDSLTGSRNNRDKILIVSDYLKRCISKSKFRYINDPSLSIVNQIIVHKGAIKFFDIPQHYFLSKRTFERKFLNTVGITAKHFARLIRFQYSLDHIRSNPFNRFSGSAYDLGYSDQSHFIREFKEFTGTTPKRYFKNRKESVANFPELLL